MKKLVFICLLSFTLIIAIASCIPNSSTTSSGDIIVASKDFTEQDILGEILAQQIEATTNLKVVRRPRLGGSFVCHSAITAGKIDAYIEYTGTAFTGILKQKAVNNPQIVYEKLKQAYAQQFNLEVMPSLGFENTFAQAYAQQFNLEVMPSLGFENTFAIIIRGEDANRYNIQKLSEAAKYTPQWRGGFGYEFLEREDGFPGLAKTYNLQFAKPPRIMDLGLIYRALIQKQVDMVAGNSTDGQIARLGLVVLKDDKQYFPPYEATPIVRQEILAKYPQLKKAIAQLAGIITADEMRQLNYLVEGELRDIKEVVREFRKSKSLSSKPKSVAID